MSTTTAILPLDLQRGRREWRLRRSLGLLAHDQDRARLAFQLGDLLTRVGGDRAVLAWIDELEPSHARAHVVVDLASDRPRRAVESGLLLQAWERGVPGFVDRPRATTGGRGSGASAGAVAVVALGSDGLRAWFVVVDGPPRRFPLSEDRMDELAFRAGEMSGVVLHPGFGSAPSIWATLTPGETDSPADDGGSRVVRFLVLRLLRAVEAEAFACEPDVLGERLEALADAVEPFAAEPEGRLWAGILSALAAPTSNALRDACVKFGRYLDDAGELESALESYRIAFEVCAALGDAGGAVEVARLLGRTSRNVGRWDASESWYATCVTLAQLVEDGSAEAIAMDGWANTLRVRGAYPAARRRLDAALGVARLSGSGSALGAVHHSLMTLAALTGETTRALEHGWAAIEAYDTRRERLRALVTLGGLLVELDQGELAEQAYEAALARLDEPYYRLFALDGHAHAAALRGDRESYVARSRQVDAADWRPGGPDFTGQVYLYRGRAWARLGCPAEARSWFGRAVAWAETHGLNATLFAAQEGVARLAEAAEPPGPARLDPEAARWLEGRLERVDRALAGSGV